MDYLNIRKCAKCCHEPILGTNLHLDTDSLTINLLLVSRLNLR